MLCFFDTKRVLYYSLHSFFLNPHKHLTAWKKSKPELIFLLLYYWFFINPANLNWMRLCFFQHYHNNILFDVLIKYSSVIKIYHFFFLKGQYQSLIYIFAPLREKCPNTEFFLVRISLYSDWVRRFMEYNTGK